jgi:hypothetical protein
LATRKLKRQPRDGIHHTPQRESAAAHHACTHGRLLVRQSVVMQRVLLLVLVLLVVATVRVWCGGVQQPTAGGLHAAAVRVAPYRAGVLHVQR